jgi:hypothetical protein
MPKKMPPMPVQVRIDEHGFDMIFKKADVNGPKRGVPVDKLVKKLKKIRRNART